ncbi:substrate-specific activator of APC-dependent proteolysis [Savitreella phatthalungensis]
MRDDIFTSPRKKRIKTGGDRFIPSREGVDLLAAFNLDNSDATRRGSGSGSPATATSATSTSTTSDSRTQKVEEANRNFSNLLRMELFGDTVPSAIATVQELAGEQPVYTTRCKTPPRSSTPIGGAPGTVTRGSRGDTPASNPGSGGSERSHLIPPPSTPKSQNRSLFTYMSPSQRSSSTPSSRTPSRRPDPNHEIYSLSPVRFDSQRLLTSPQRKNRTISKVPYKVLDAPELQDDFYLNLVDWGSGNKLAVGLNHCVYLWSAGTGKVTKLCDLGAGDPVTSVSWIQRGSHVALGTTKGLVHIWDAETQKKTRTMTGHTNRVGALAWNDSILSSGSRDRLIYHRDVRIPEHHIKCLRAHRQEVCGLKWNCEDGQLASGGNDNKLIIWDGLSETPLHKFSQHTAAVKAIAWNPHQRGVLGSGGGTQDRTIKFWNTLVGRQLSEIDTGSQVCNLAWSKTSNELVSTHGYSENQVVVWKYPNMSQVASLTGHTYRVLYLAMSPDGQNIVTGAGDETLRFWNVFGKSKFDENKRLSVLDPTLKIR